MRQQEICTKQAASENMIMKEVFDNQYMVHNGPFKGLKYIKSSSGSTFLPKIIGSYEEPIQKWIEDIISNGSYKKIIDIGCAEGYYACGFALKLPETEIMAYDIDEKARYNTQNLATLNGLKNIIVKSECTHMELNQQSDKDTLIFCDIEGYEDYLLNPVLAPNIKFSDLIVETHDWVKPGITDRLIERFLRTHKISSVVDYPFRLKSYKTPRKVNNQKMEYIFDEKRPKAMKFLLLESIYE